jgi:hypothetical protein
VPDKVLELLSNPAYALFPSLGGVHYLLINFALKRDTKAVVSTFNAMKVGWKYYSIHNRVDEGATPQCPYLPHPDPGVC